MSCRRCETDCKFLVSLICCTLAMSPASDSLKEAAIVLRLPRDAVSRRVGARGRAGPADAGVVARKLRMGDDKEHG